MSIKSDVGMKVKTNTHAIGISIGVMAQSKPEKAMVVAAQAPQRAIRAVPIILTTELNIEQLTGAIHRQQDSAADDKQSPGVVFLA